MILNHTRTLFAAIALACGLLILGNATTASAKQEHHDAKKLLGGAAKDGHHDIDHHGKYTASVEMRHGKVHEVHVRHPEKGDIPLKKYKANRKMAMASGGHVVLASLAEGQMQDMGTVYIGYSYVDDEGDEEIYWFPAEMLEDPYTGAVDYVPTNS
jgi:hypothetical protein